MTLQGSFDLLHLSLLPARLQPARLEVPAHNHLLLLCVCSECVLFRQCQCLFVSISKQFSHLFLCIFASINFLNHFCAFGSAFALPRSCKVRLYMSIIFRICIKKIPQNAGLHFCTASFIPMPLNGIQGERWCLDVIGVDLQLTFSRVFFSFLLIVETHLSFYFPFTVLQHFALVNHIKP